MLYQKFVVEIRESVVESMIIKQGKVEIFSQPKEKVKCFYQKVSEVSLSRFNSSMSDEFYIKNLESALKNCTGSNLKYRKLKNVWIVSSLIVLSTVLNLKKSTLNKCSKCRFTRLYWINRQQF